MMTDQEKKLDAAFGMVLDALLAASKALAVHDDRVGLLYRTPSAVYFQLYQCSLLMDALKQGLRARPGSND